MDRGVCLLLQRVWGLEYVNYGRQWAKRYLLYRQHYHNVVATSFIDNLGAEQLVEVVECIKPPDVRDLILPDVINHLKAQKFSWLCGQDGEGTLVHVLQLAVTLWLFTTLDLRTHRGTLREAVSARFTDALDSRPNDDLVRLSDDFSAKNLERRGGFVMHWTSELDEHLTCVDRKVIKIFCHGSIIQDYLQRADDTERSIYPSSLLSEIDNTFYLLFPYQGVKATKRMWKESKKRRVDLVEAGWADEAVGELARLQLKTYPRYGNRLAEIQRRYDAAIPVSPKQWWYDRRRRMEWAALMITILVLILTVITVVTSIMQVYAAFNQPANTGSA